MNKIIAVDFDGTLCENKYPLAGEPNWPLIKYLNESQRDGAKIILWTCRSKKNLRLAIEWCRKKGLIFDEVNKNTKEAKKMFGGDSRKIYADEYIDDKVNTSFDLPFHAN